MRTAFPDPTPKAGAPEMTAALPRVVNAPTSLEHHNAGIHTASVPVSNVTSAELVLNPESRAWRRRLGALAWAALEIGPRRASK